MGSMHRRLLLREEYPDVVVRRRPNGDWELGDVTTSFDDPPMTQLQLLCYALQDKRDGYATPQRRGGLSNLPLYMILEAGPDTPAVEMNALLSVLARCGVENIDAVVERADPPWYRA